MFRTIWLMLGGILTVATILTAIVIICCIAAGGFIVMRHHDAPGTPGTPSSHAMSLPIAGPAKQTFM
jgi:hypothetical protein